MISSCRPCSALLTGTDWTNSGRAPTIDRILTGWSPRPAATVGPSAAGNQQHAEEYDGGSGQAHRGEVLLEEQPGGGQHHHVTEAGKGKGVAKIDTRQRHQPEDRSGDVDCQCGDDVRVRPN